MNSDQSIKGLLIVPMRRRGDVAFYDLDKVFNPFKRQKECSADSITCCTPYNRHENNNNNKKNNSRELYFHLPPYNKKMKCIEHTANFYPLCRIIQMCFSVIQTWQIASKLLCDSKIHWINVWSAKWPDIANRSTPWI